MMLIDPRFPVIAVGGAGPDQGKLLGISPRSAREARVLLGDRGSQRAAGDRRPRAGGAAHLALARAQLVRPRQMPAYHTAVLKGYDVDHPPNLAKSVTLE